MLDTSCSFHLLNKTVIDECKSFTCGNDDLDDFFKNEAENYTKQLIAKSYCFRLKSDLSVMICAFTLSNSKIKVKGLKKRKEITQNIPHGKILEGYPAVLIGRLGVDRYYQRQGIGNELSPIVYPIWQNKVVFMNYSQTNKKIL
jgi:hypothetical protein